MKISPLKPIDEPYFNELAFSHGTIFNTDAWTKLFNDCITYYGIYNKGDELIGGFILYREKKYGLSFYRNPPFTPEVGPFLKVDASNPVSIMEKWKEALSLISEFIDTLPYSVVSVALNKNIQDMQPFLWRKFKVSPGYTYVIDLSVNHEDIWKGMSNERRKNVNKGSKDGLIARKITEYETVKELVLKTYSRQDKEVNKLYLDKILFDFAKEHNSYAFVTFDKEIPVGCAFCIYDNKTAYYLLGGYDSANKHHGAGAMSMWEAIKHAQKLGLKYFDFEGSMVPQIERYFRGFGGQLTSYYTVNKAIFPLEVILKLIKREMF